MYDGHDEEDVWMVVLYRSYIVLQEVPVGVRQKLLERIGDFA